MESVISMTILEIWIILNYNEYRFTSYIRVAFQAKVMAASLVICGLPQLLLLSSNFWY